MSAQRRAPVDVQGPYFEDLRQGEVVGSAPSLTLTEGHAAVHQAIVGDRLRLALDAGLSRRVLGGDRAMAHPALVCDVAIGQSTLLTQRVIANLFYRGLALRRVPLIGDTLHTSTEVVALRQNSLREDRPVTGLAVLRIRTIDQEQRPVLDFLRCAMLPLRERTTSTGHAADLDSISADVDTAALLSLVASWRVQEFAAAVPGLSLDALSPGTVWSVGGGDVVSGAPELARMSLNVAMAHHDASVGSGGRRLVYGGHTIAIAAAQATRALPNLLTILAWHGCAHLAPVYEGDTLHSELELERLEAAPGGAGLVHLRSRVRAVRANADDSDVLDWRFIGVVA
jgi:acyl dehydratase